MRQATAFWLRTAAQNAFGGVAVSRLVPPMFTVVRFSCRPDKAWQAQRSPYLQDSSLPGAQRAKRGIRRMDLRHAVKRLLFGPSTSTFHADWLLALVASLPRATGKRRPLQSLAGC